MPGAVQVVHGDMFSGPADLIVMPCSTGGYVTRFVAERMQRFALPPPPRPIPLGEVRLFPLPDAGQLAQFVAYAASVQSHESSPEAIRRIGEELGRATRKESVQVVHCPLLGAGAGRLRSETVEAQLRQGFHSTCKDGSLLKIFVLHKDVYERLVRHSMTETQTPAQATLVPSPSLSQGEQRLTSGRLRPRVFISYAKASPENQQWVERLYEFLSGNDINARMDSHSLRPGMDIQQWMCNELDLADRVILVCDEEYAARADRRHGGVGWETMIIQGDMYADMNRDRPEGSPAKYIPVVRSATRDDGLPAFLRTKLTLDWPPGQAEEELRRRLLDEILQDWPAIPPISSTRSARDS